MTPSEQEYERAAVELQSEKRRPGLWAQAFAAAQGDDQRARAKYIELRAQQLASERRSNEPVPSLAEDASRPRPDEAVCAVQETAGVDVVAPNGRRFEWRCSMVLTTRRLFLADAPKDGKGLRSKTVLFSLALPGVTMGIGMALDALIDKARAWGDDARANELADHIGQQILSTETGLIARCEDIACNVRIPKPYNVLQLVFLNDTFQMWQFCIQGNFAIGPNPGHYKITYHMVPGSADEHLKLLRRCRDLRIDTEHLATHN